VNNPSVLAVYLPHLLTIIRLLIANGPIGFAESVQPHLTSWTDSPLRGQPIPGQTGGPFSIFRFGAPGAETIIGLIALEVCRKLRVVAHPELLSWSKAALLAGYPQPMQLVVFAGVMVSLSSPQEHSEEGLSLAETAMLSLWTKSANDLDAAQSLAMALRDLGGLFGANDSEFVDWASQGIQSGLERITALLERFAPRFASSPNYVLRSAVAELLSQVSHRHSLSPALAQALAKLAQDKSRSCPRV
jgi:hypothetical protein